MRLYINGEEHEVAESLALAQLIEQFALAPERLAVELNREVVRRDRWAQTVLTADDRIEIVHFVGGGAS